MGWIGDTFTDDPTQSWRSSAQHLVNEDVDATPGFADALRTRLAEQLATPQDHEEQHPHRLASDFDNVDHDGGIVRRGAFMGNTSR